MAENKACTTCGRRFGDEALFCPKDGSALVSATSANAIARALERDRDTLVGRIILGQFEVKALIGAGAMGRVYRAFQQGVERDVAVKILHRDLAQNPDIVARFLREAKVASRLTHPNLVSVLLSGQLEDGTMYLVMEYLDGISVQAAMMAAGGAMPLPRALHMTLQIADAVGEAHTASVVHRDIKPENVMLIPRGDDPDFVKVLDFGIARLGSKDAGAIETQAGLVFGTARYLSPEGARGEQVGPPSDVYAIATMLYQALAGRTPFENDSSVSLLVAQIHEPPPPLRTVARAAYVHPAIERVVMKNLAKDPALRDVDGHAFGRALLVASTESGLSVDDLIARPTLARPLRAATPPIAQAVPQFASQEKTREHSYGLRAQTPAPPPMPEQSDAARPFYDPSYSGRPSPAANRRLLDQTLDDLTPLDPKSAPTALHPETVSGAQIDVRDSHPSNGGRTDDSLHGDRIADEFYASEAPPGVPRRGRLLAIGLALAIIGSGLVGVGAYRSGLFAPKPAPSSSTAKVDGLLSRADAALQSRAWDTPAGENVVALTDQALAIAPNDARIYALRSSAADRLVREAIEARAQKDYSHALQSFALAQRLSGTDKAIDEEFESTEAEAAADPHFVGLVADAGALRFSATVHVGAGTSVDGDPVRVGDVAKLVATVTGDTAPTGIDAKAHFHVRGVGIDRSVVVAAQPGGASSYTATYTFARPGNFTVVFFGRPDAFPVEAVVDVKVLPRGAFFPSPPPHPGASTMPHPSALPSSTPRPASSTPSPSTSGTIVLTPEPVSLPVPSTTPAPPPPLPTLP